MTHPELRYVRPPDSQHETVHECAPEVWAESLYDCGPVRGSAPLSVRFPVRAADRVHVSASARRAGRSAVRWCVQGYFPARARITGRGCGWVDCRVYDLAPVRTPGRSCDRSPAWGYERVTGPTAGRVAHPVQE